MIALTRLFSNHGEGLLEGRGERGATDGAQMRVNFKNSLLTVRAISRALRHAGCSRNPRHPGAIVSCRQTRPNRSYPRRSRKPIQVETGKAGEGRGVGMTACPKTPLSGNASLSEWRPLSECLPHRARARRVQVRAAQPDIESGRPMLALLLEQSSQAPATPPVSRRLQ